MITFKVLLCLLGAFGLTAGAALMLAGLIAAAAMRATWPQTYRAAVRAGIGAALLCAGLLAVIGAWPL